MKHLLLLLSFLTPMLSLAYDFKVDNVCYKITSLADKVCEVCADTDENGYVGDIVIPSNVSYENIEFSVNAIGYSAFANCYNLKSIHIPASISKVGNGAFSYCTSLESVVIEDSPSPLELGYNEMTYDSYKDGEGLFYRSSISSVYIGRPITFLTARRYGYSPFYKSRLEKVKFSSFVTEIPSRLFYSCHQLAEVVFTPSILKIQDFAFIDCAKLVELNFVEGLQSIGSEVFKNTGIVNVVIPQSVQSIGSSFRACKSLETVYILNDNMSIGDYAFCECSSLKTINLPTTMTSIPQSLFEGCFSLDYFPLPENITEIKFSAFNSCTSFTSITLPDKLESIASNAFDNCTNLKIITLPSSLSFLGFHAFFNCNNIETIICNASTPPAADTMAYENHSFENGIYIRANLYVPNTSIDSYKNTSPWDNFFHVLPVDDYSGIEDIKVSTRIPQFYFNTNGLINTSPFEGINIIKYSDGTTEKVLIP